MLARATNYNRIGRLMTCDILMDSIPHTWVFWEVVCIDQKQVGLGKLTKSRRLQTNPTANQRECLHDRIMHGSRLYWDRIGGFKRSTIIGSEDTNEKLKHSIRQTHRLQNRNVGHCLMGSKHATDASDPSVHWIVLTITHKLFNWILKLFHSPKNSYVYSELHTATLHTENRSMVICDQRVF